jgi:hypothetical protein
MADPQRARFLQGILQDLGVSQDELAALQKCSLAEGQRKLDELKERVRKNFKRLAFELHPDRTGNDPAKTERFKAICEVRDGFERLGLAPRPAPVPPVMHVTRVSWVRAGTAYNRAATSTTTGTGVPWRITVMRPF